MIAVPCMTPIWRHGAWEERPKVPLWIFHCLEKQSSAHIIIELSTIFERMVVARGSCRTAVRLDDARIVAWNWNSTNSWRQISAVECLGVAAIYSVTAPSQWFSTFFYIFMNVIASFSCSRRIVAVEVDQKLEYTACFLRLRLSQSYTKYTW